MGIDYYKCDYCDECFGDCDDIMNEITVRVGKKDYIVEMCGTCFRKNVSEGVFLPLHHELEDEEPLMKLLKPFDIIKSVWETLKPEKEE